MLEHVAELSDTRHRMLPSNQAPPTYSEDRAIANVKEIKAMAINQQKS